MDLRREREIRNQLEKQQRDARWETSFDRDDRIRKQTEERQKRKWDF